MKTRSKEDKLLELFFNEPTRQWHFEELRQEAAIDRKQLSRWLTIFQKEHLTCRVKPREKMPYYVADYRHPNYQNRKRLFALSMLHKSGLLPALLRAERAKTIILFGSMARWDWHKDSDIDLFVYGDFDKISIGHYELVLGKEIQLFIARDKEDLQKFGENLLKHILKGDLLKGDIDFVSIRLSEGAIA